MIDKKDDASITISGKRMVWERTYPQELKDQFRDIINFIDGDMREEFEDAQANAEIDNDYIKKECPYCNESLESIDTTVLKLKKLYEDLLEEPFDAENDSCDDEEGYGKKNLSGISIKC